MNFKTVVDAKQYCNLTGRECVVFRDAGFYIVSKENTVFVSFLTVNSISDVWMNFDWADHLYDSMYGITITLNNKKYNIYSNSINCNTTIYSPTHFSDIKDIKSFFKWLFNLSYIDNPNFANFEKVFEKELNEEKEYISEIRTELISKYNDFMKNFKK